MIFAIEKGYAMELILIDYGNFRALDILLRGRVES